MNLRILVRHRLTSRLLEHLLQRLHLRAADRPAAVTVEVGVGSCIAACAWPRLLLYATGFSGSPFFSFSMVRYACSSAACILARRPVMSAVSRYFSAARWSISWFDSMNSMRACFPARVRGRPEPASAWNEKPPSRSAFRNFSPAPTVLALDLQEPRLGVVLLRELDHQHPRAHERTSSRGSPG
jgi:hypothetical protein